MSSEVIGYIAVQTAFISMAAFPAHLVAVARRLSLPVQEHHRQAAERLLPQFV